MHDKKLRFIFLVQGEGRGHMTQAIVLSQWLKECGHEVAHTFVGKSKRRKIPDYFIEQVGSEVQALISPNFVLNKENKSLKLFSTIIYNARFLRTYYKSLRTIDQKIKLLKADVLINFYDFLGGFYFYFFKPKLKHVAIGHQFLSGHPDFPFANDKPIEKRLFLLNNRLTSIRAIKKLALSFRAYHPTHIEDLVIVPPLIRKEVKTLKVEKQDFILGYMVNDGYGEEIMDWHEQHPEEKVHVFWDRKEVSDPYKKHKNLIFHQINDKTFIDFMRRCKGYISTAGFESICEAMYLGKPVLLIPVTNQYEQACNAIDAQITGAGISGNTFDISRLLDYLPNYKPVSPTFKKWEAQAKDLIVEELTNMI